MTTTPTAPTAPTVPAAVDRPPVLGAGRSRNPRLREAMLRGRWTNERLAHAVGVDPKTVNRWVNRGRTPHRSTATRAAAVLGAEAHHLWPDLHRPTTRALHPEVRQVWTRRADAPLGLWWDLFTGAHHEIDVLCRTGAFLHIHLPDLVGLLRARARAGCMIRIVLTGTRHLPDPDSTRDAPWSLDPEDTPALHQMSLGRFASLTDHPHTTLRTHHTVHTDLYRADNDMLLTHHLPGTPAARSPLWHLTRTHTGLFDTHHTAFTHTWNHATPHHPKAQDPADDQNDGPGR